MRTEYRRGDWAGRLVGLIFLLIITATLAQAMVEMVRPWLPYVLLVSVLAGATWVVRERRNRW